MPTRQVAAAFIVMTMEPGLSAHRAAWADAGGSADMFEVINKLSRAK